MKLFCRNKFGKYTLQQLNEALLKVNNEIGEKMLYMKDYSSLEEKKEKLLAEKANRRTSSNKTLKKTSSSMFDNFTMGELELLKEKIGKLLDKLLKDSDETIETLTYKRIEVEIIAELARRIVSWQKPLTDDELIRAIENDDNACDIKKVDKFLEILYGEINSIKHQKFHPVKVIVVKSPFNPNLKNMELPIQHLDRALNEGTFDNKGVVLDIYFNDHSEYSFVRSESKWTWMKRISDSNDSDNYNYGHIQSNDGTLKMSIEQLVQQKIANPFFDESGMFPDFV